MSEFFPGLATRGWLERSASDCTSQRLTIHHAKEQLDLTRITVHSQTLDELTQFFDSCRDENTKQGIEVSFQCGKIVIDGTAMKVSSADAKRFRFPKKMEVSPFPKPYEVPATSAAEREFVRSLTTKSATTGSIISFDSLAYNALELRAVVKEIRLFDSFDRISSLVADDPGITQLRFIDTPGLGTAKSIATDEILYHAAGKKAANIVIQLWLDDELDFLVHMLLCGSQSTFASVWQEVLTRVTPEDAASLEERLVLLVNGTSHLFEDDNIRKLHDNPAANRVGEDHFQLVLKTNALDKMSPTGTLTPAAICFVDTLFGLADENAYATRYRKYRPVMEGWRKPGAVGFTTLSNLDIENFFQSNIDSLCDPADRGHSHLIRTILRLAKNTGPQLVIKKHLVRSLILDTANNLRDMLLQFYDASGALNTGIYLEAARSVVHANELSDLLGFEAFSVRVIDPCVDECVTNLAAQQPVSPNWAVQAWDAVFDTLCQNLTASSVLSPVSVAAFAAGFASLAAHFRTQWGYDTCPVEIPRRNDKRSVELLRHGLKLHARELVYLMSSNEQDLGTEAAPEQTASDQNRVQDILHRLESLSRSITNLASTHGVQI